MTPTEIAALFDRHFSDALPTSVGVAVSGGSDSLALLHLATDWAARHDIAVHAATVDHGLRPEAKDEARHVSDLCAGLNIPHSVLSWQGWDGQGNLQAEARKARYHLLAAWGQARDLDQILIGHTQDDQAETFLIRLCRKSGVEGLAAMQPVFDRHGQRFGRPLLGATRDSLRDLLQARHVTWCDDLSNTDPTFDRVRAREALRHLAPLGLVAETLAAVSRNLASARDALDHVTRQTAQTCCRVEHGDVVFEAAALFALPDEITHRLLGSALKWISGSEYAPRSESIITLRAALRAGQTATLSGCLATPARGEIRLTREAGAVQGLISLTPRWDRWQITGPWQEGMQIRALSSRDLSGLSEWRDTGLPRKSLLASPAVCYDETLIAAPLAGFAQGFAANLLPNRANLPVLGD